MSDPLKSKRFIYIAGPISSNPAGHLVSALAAADQLFRAGAAPYVPHLMLTWDQFHKHAYEEWMELDFAWITRCDAMLRLPGPSKGADREVYFARANNIPVFYSLAAALKWASR